MVTIRSSILIAPAAAPGAAAAAAAAAADSAVMSPSPILLPASGRGTVTRFKSSLLPLLLLLLLPPLTVLLFEAKLYVLALQLASLPSVRWKSKPTTQLDMLLTVSLLTPRPLLMYNISLEGAAVLQILLL
jgi:hypothetical protein